MLKLNVLYNAVYLSRSIRPNKYPKIEFEIESKVRHSLFYIPLPFERQIQTSLRTWLCGGTYKHVWGVYGFLVTPSSTPDGQILDPDHPDQKIWKKSGSQKSYFWCKWLPFKPGWPQMVIFWMSDHPDPEIWEKSGLLKITFLVLMASLNPWLTPNGYSFDTRSPRWGSRPNIWKKSGSQKVIFWCSLLCLTPARHLMVIFLDARWKYLDDNFKI